MNRKRKLSRAHRKPAAPAGAGHVETVPAEQKATKAVAAALVTILGLLGITVTDGTAQLIVMVGQLLLVTYGVWRVRNDYKSPPPMDLDDIQ